MDLDHIRNFCIVAHIDHGKSTLADRMLEITGTVEARRMKPQYLDQLELERERGITIKMAPVRMAYHANRGTTQTDTQTDADSELLYADLTYKIRGCIFAVRKNLGLGHKEPIYQKALAIEFEKAGIPFEREKTINTFYDNQRIGVYRPDFVVDEKVLLELKALPFLGQNEEKQFWSYLRGSSYKLGLLANFGGKDIEVKRVVYDSARIPRESASSPRESASSAYMLNLIDTPGHSDFSYEVSRALAAVEGAILLVDATKGIQAQTLANFRVAKKAGLTIIGAINKVDLLQSQIGADDTRMNADVVEKRITELAALLECEQKDVLRVSGKTGEGVSELLQAVIEKVPPPLIREHLRLDPRLRPASDGQARTSAGLTRALIFDSLYDDHKGILAYVRVVEGELRPGTEVTLLATDTKCKLKEVGCFAPELRPIEALHAGEIGYLATGLKEPALVKIGDTILTADTRGSHPRIYADADNGTRINADSIRENPRLDPRQSAAWALQGYKEPAPVVFISFYPDGETKFEDLRKAFERLRLTDAALSFEPDANDALGRGLKAGFLGKLHFEIVASRLEREFGLAFLTSFPSIAFRVKGRGQTQTGTQTNAESSWRVVKEATAFPLNPEAVLQPMIRLEIVLPSHYVNHVANLKQAFQLEIQSIETIGESSVISARMPLMELIRDFDDQLKSVSAGYASFSYELDGESPGDVEKLEILAAGEVMPALTRIVFKKELEHEARATVERLKDLLPREQFSLALQAQAQGRIIARETIPAMRKDVTGYLYGGDRSRKMKLWKKQQRGKERLKERGRVHIPVSVFREILKK